MLVNCRRIAAAYREALRAAETRAEDQGRIEVAEAFQDERRSLELHVRGATAVSLDALEAGFPIDPPFEPRFPRMVARAASHL